MDQNSGASDGYFSVLDNFGSEVGSTLDDLATHWEDSKQNYNDDDTSYSGSQYSSRSHSILSTDSGNIMDNLGKRLAKPLFFYNPVYSLVYKDTIQSQVKRPTLIPLAQLNGKKKSEDIKYRKASGGKPGNKKKNPHHTHGIFSKISAVTRRHSHTSLIDDDVHLSVKSDERKSSLTSLDEKSNQTSTKHVDNQVASDHEVPIRKSSSGAAYPSPSVVNKEQKIKIPPTKSPRTSRIIADEDMKNIMGSACATDKEEQPVPIPVPRKRTKPSPILSRGEDKVREVEQEQLTTSSLLVPTKPGTTANTPDSSSHTMMSHESATNFGSLNSICSSDELSFSDSDVKSMADVITEISMEAPDQPESPHHDATDNPADFVEAPGLLRRNKTLRWTGTHKAPALIREFTRKQKQSKKNSSELGSPSKEVEMATRKSRIISDIADSRSCTPSQMTTSFGMGDSEGMSDGMNNDGDVSSSENSDSSTTIVQAPQKNRTKQNDASNRESAFIVLSSLLPPAPRLRRTQSSKVRAYLQKMGSNANNALGYAVMQFVEQTLKHKEERPLVLLHDVRSFLTDIKRYLISNPHIGLVKKIQKIVSKSSMVDVEGAVDDALDRLVLYPLHDLVYRCLVMDYTKSGQLSLIQDAINLAKKKTPKELGIRETLIPPDQETLEVIKGHFVQLQRTYSPYFKLKELLAAVTKIYQNTQDLNMEDRSARKIGADDFLPLLVYAIVQCDFIAADIETRYIDGLLDPALLLGEGGYYLTTLISAVQVVFSMKRKEAALPNISDLQGFLKVGISPSESNPHSKPATDDEVVLHKTLHVPPAMTSRSLCQMISKKFNVTVPENYCLHVIVNGVPHALEANECPQLVKMDLLTQFAASAFYFSFQRRDSSSKHLQTKSVVVEQTDDLLVALTDDVQVQNYADASTNQPDLPKISIRSDDDGDGEQENESMIVASPDSTEADTTLDVRELEAVTEPYGETVAFVETSLTNEVSPGVAEMKSDNPTLHEDVIEFVHFPVEQADESEITVLSDTEEAHKNAMSQAAVVPSDPGLITVPNLQSLRDALDQAEASLEELELIEDHFPAEAESDINSKVIPEISVTFTTVASNPQTAADNQSVHSSASSGMEEVFDQPIPNKRKSCVVARDTVASLTDYFERRSTDNSPLFSHN